MIQDFFQDFTVSQQADYVGIVPIDFGWRLTSIAMELLPTISGKVYFSFDGQTDHGVMDKAVTAGYMFDRRPRSRIWFRSPDSATQKVRLMAWRDSDM